MRIAKEEELNKRKLAIDTKQSAAAERRNVQLGMSNSQKSPKNKTRSPKKVSADEQEGQGWFGVVGSVAVAAVAAATFFVTRR